MPLTAVERIVGRHLRGRDVSALFSGLTRLRHCHVGPGCICEGNAKGNLHRIDHGHEGVDHGHDGGGIEWTEQRRYPKRIQLVA